MATGFVLRNVCASIDGVRVDDHIREIAVNLSAADVDFTAMGNGGHQRQAGIRDDTLTMTVYSDFAASSIHATISPKFVSAGTFEVKVAASGSTISATNPLFIGYCPALSYNPVSGAVGDAAMTPLEFPVNGTVTIATGGTL